MCTIFAECTCFTNISIDYKKKQTAQKALTKHKQTIGARYVEIFKSTAAEVQQVERNYITILLNLDKYFEFFLIKIACLNTNCCL